MKCKWREGIWRLEDISTVTEALYSCVWTQCEVQYEQTMSKPQALCRSDLSVAEFSSKVRVQSSSGMLYELHLTQLQTIEWKVGSGGGLVARSYAVPCCTVHTY